MSDINKPDDEVNVRVASCGKCNGVVMASVEHMMSKKAKKEFSKLVMIGCDAKTITLISWRENEINWCDCDEAKININPENK